MSNVQIQHQSLSSISHDVPNSAQHRHQHESGSRRRELALNIEGLKEHRERVQQPIFREPAVSSSDVVHIHKAVWKKAEVGWSVVHQVRCPFACLVTSAAPSTKRGLVPPKRVDNPKIGGVVKIQSDLKSKKKIERRVSK
jgi:hypothetical protein